MGIALIGIVLVSTSCGQKTPVVGKLSMSDMEAKMIHEQYTLTGEQDEAQAGVKKEVGYDSLASLQLALESGHTDYASLDLNTAQYMQNMNPDVTVIPDRDGVKIAYAMALMPENSELADRLSTIITTLEITGQLDELCQTWIYNSGALTATQNIEMPHFDDAPTIRVGVTGDIPPMDYMNTAGEPAGFNVAFLQAVAQTGRINIEIVPVATEARITALFSGRIDAIFWINSANYSIGASTDGTLILTRSYFQTQNAFVSLSYPEENIRTIERLDEPSLISKAYPGSQAVYADILSYTRREDGVLGITILRETFARELGNLESGDFLLANYGGKSVCLSMSSSPLSQAAEKGVLTGLRSRIEASRADMLVICPTSSSAYSGANRVNLELAFLNDSNAQSARDAFSKNGVALHDGASLFSLWMVGASEDGVALASAADIPGTELRLLFDQAIESPVDIYALSDSGEVSQVQTEKIMNADGKVEAIACQPPQRSTLAINW